MLASNMFFWDWIGSPTLPPPPLTDSQIQRQQRGYGSKGNDDYHPMPEDYWEDRKKVIQVDKRDPSKVFEVPEMPSGPKVLNHAVAAQLDELSSQRDQLTSQLRSVPTVKAMLSVAAEIRSLDRQISQLERKKFH